MKKILFIIGLMLSVLLGNAQQTPPPFGANFKNVPTTATYYDSITKTFWTYNGTEIGWTHNSLDSKLPLNSKIGFQGNSIMAEGYTELGTTTYYNSNGIAAWAMLLSNHRFKIPVNGIIAVPGDYSSSTLNKNGRALKLGLDVVVIEVGTNDIASDFSASSVIANLSNIYAAHIANGTRIIDLCILPRFGDKTLTANQLIQRNIVNEWKRTQTTYPTTLLDFDGKLNASHFYDGLHPNKLGAKVIGGEIAKILNSWTIGNVADNVGNDNNLIANGINLSGAGGYLSGATGQLLDNFNLQVYNVGGVNITASKTVENDLNKQNISMQGSHTGDGDVTLSADATKPYALGDVIEGIVDFDLPTDAVGLKAINLILTVYDSSNQILQTVEAFSTSTNNIPITFSSGRYQLRTPQMLLSQGVPNMIRLSIKLVAHESSSAENIDVVTKIHKIVLRKTEALIAAGGLTPAQVQALPLIDNVADLVPLADFAPYRTSSGFIKYKVPTVN